MRFIWFLCKDIFHTTPDDERITDMDPVQKLFMYHNWLADQKDNIELAKNHAYLIGSFFNPEAVKSITDDSNKHMSTDEEFEESTRMVAEANSNINKENDKSKRRRRRIPLKG
jgi:hypothetical protein